MDVPQVTPPPYDPFMVRPWMEAIRRSWELWFELTFPLAPRPWASPTSTPTSSALVPGVAPAPLAAIAPAAIAETGPVVLPSAADVAPTIGRESQRTPAPPAEPTRPTVRPDSLDGWLDHLITVRRQGLADTGRYVIPKTLLAEASAATGEAETRLIRLVNARDPEHQGAALDPEAHAQLEDRVLGAAVDEIVAHRQRSGRTEIPPEVLAATAAELRRSPASTRRLLLQRLYGDTPASPPPATAPAAPAADRSATTGGRTRPARPATRPVAPTRRRGTPRSDKRARNGAGTVAVDRNAASKEFAELVNMTPAKLERWLEQGASKSAGERRGGSKKESTGHASGRRIVEIKRKRKGDLTDDDYAHMRKVVGYIKRHLAQRPDGDISDSRWRHSLMNWGHDPLAKSR